MLGEELGQRSSYRVPVCTRNLLDHLARSAVDAGKLLAPEVDLAAQLLPDFVAEAFGDERAIALPSRT